MSRAYRNYLLSFYDEKEARKEHRTIIRNLCDPAEFPEQEFLRIYKISPQMITYLCAELDEDLAPKTSTGLPVLVKVLSSLKILTTGHYQRSIGQEQDSCIGQTTVSKYFGQFLNAVTARLTPAWIKFPGGEDGRKQVAAGFQQQYGLPNILGCVDCTHVDLFPPPQPTQAQFINRHGNTSLNVQLIADAECRILNVNANYPGRIHDQFIFNNSVVKAEMRRLYNNRIGSYYLLGDSGYALEPWLMTPIRNAPYNSPEYKYTKWHCHTRNLIERTNGYLKGTFRSLGVDRTLHYSAEKAAKVVYASCTLYNIMRHFRVPMELHNVTQQESQYIPNLQPNTHLLTVANIKRNHIVAEYFT